MYRKCVEKVQADPTLENHVGIINVKAGGGYFFLFHLLSRIGWGWDAVTTEQIAFVKPTGCFKSSWTLFFVQMILV